MFQTDNLLSCVILQERSSAYGLVSATFAASLVTSPALGAYLSEYYGDSLVVLLATIVSVADVIFIVLFVPESLPSRRSTPGSGQVTPNEVFNWHSADPFGSLRIVWEDKLVSVLHVKIEIRRNAVKDSIEPKYHCLRLDPTTLCHRLPLLPSRVWTVLVLLRLPQTRRRILAGSRSHVHRTRRNPVRRRSDRPFALADESGRHETHDNTWIDLPTDTADLVWAGNAVSFFYQLIS